MNNIIVVKSLNGEEFHNAMSSALSNNKRCGYVELCDSSEYDNMPSLLVLNDDGAGVAVKENGEIGSLFKNCNSDLKGVIDLLLPIAILNGGTHMNCFGEFLAKKYMDNGFIPIAKCKFNDNCAPINWNYEQDGRPNLYFLCLFTNSIDKLVKSMGKSSSDSFEQVCEQIPTLNYEEAEEFTNSILNKLSSENLDYESVISMVSSGYIMDIYDNEKGIKAI